MSRHFTLAYAIQERIESLDGLSESVMVDRQNDLSQEFLKRMKKVSGVAVIISMVGAKNANPKFKSLILRAAYSITIFTKGIIRSSDAERADDIVERVAESLHGWWPETIASNGTHFLRVTKADFPVNETYNIARLLVSEPEA